MPLGYFTRLLPKDYAETPALVIDRHDAPEFGTRRDPSEHFCRVIRCLRDISASALRE